MSLAIRILPEALRSLGEADISATYAAIGTPFAHPIRILRFYNSTDVTITFSFDGVNDHEILPTTGFLILDLTSNKSRDDGAYIAVGTTIYAKGDPSTGSVYVSAYYGFTGNGIVGNI